VREVTHYALTENSDRQLDQAESRVYWGLEDFEITNNTCILVISGISPLSVLPFDLQTCPSTLWCLVSFSSQPRESLTEYSAIRLFELPGN